MRGLVPLSRIALGILGLSLPLRGASGQGGEARVDSIAAPYTGDRPGLAVLVVRNDSVLLEKGYGLADIERGSAITRRTRFLLGSVSKQFTAMAVMILADRGHLAYDAPIGNYLSELSPTLGRITIRQLLHHLSGLPEYEALFVAKGLVDRDWPRSIKTRPSPYEPAARDALALLARADSLEFSPGSRFAYSNSGYMILAQIVERVSGVRFAQFLEDNVFAPLGMTETVLYDERRPAIPNRASSYTGVDGAFREIDYTPFNAIYGEDNVVTTVHDLIPWIRALDHPTLVRPATQAAAFTSGRLLNGEPTRYGFGWRLGRALGQRLILHGGSWVGFRTAIVRVPVHRLTVVVLANAAETDAEILAVRVAQAFLGDRLAPLPVARSVSAATLQRVTGTYQLQPDVAFTITVERGRASISGPRLGTHRLGFDSDSTGFFADERITRLVFRGGEPGAPWSTVEVVRPAGTFTARRAAGPARP